MSELEREQQLLIAAARSLVRAFEADRLPSMLGQDLQWPYIVKTSGNHGIAPLLYMMLARNGLEELVPPDALTSLKNNYLTSLMKNKKLYQSLADIHDVFSRDDIPMMLLKGGALGINTYEDFGLRPFSDIDILVEKKHVARCRELMETIGFEVVRGAYGVIPDERNDELGCEWTYVRDGFAVIELHWNIMTRLSPFRPDPRYYWNSAVPIEFEGRKALAMCPEDQLIHLCVHQFKHHWEHLRDLADVTLIIDKNIDMMDWTEVASRAIDQKAERCVWHTLSLAKRCLDADVPPEVFTLLGSRYHPGVTARALENMIAGSIFEEHMPRRFWELILVDETGEKIGIIRQILSRPFPRRGEDEQFGKQKAHDFRGRVRSAVKSILFYRHLLAAFPRLIFRTIRRQ